MVVAYLRGLLRKNHRYGARSQAAEDAILEAITAENIALDMLHHTQEDLAIIPVMNHDSIVATAERASKRLSRASELRQFDIYNVAEQVAAKTKRENASKEISLFRVYQIAEKQGIFDAFDEHYTEENSKPLL